MNSSCDPSDLLSTALALRATGVSILPVDHYTKKPEWSLLPLNEVGKPVWEPYQHEIATEATVRSWFDADVKSIGIVAGAISGGLLVLDFDVDGFFERWIESVGDLATGLPAQRTGGGGYQVFLRCANPGGSVKLAWAPEPKEPSGRTIAIETRGEGGYAVVPPSLHPSGKYYQWLNGDLSKIPVLPDAHVETLLAAARKLDEAPYTRKEIECAAELHQRQSTVTRNGSGSVIQAFNESASITSILEKHGYTHSCGYRYIRPGGRSRSVHVVDGRSFQRPTERREDQVRDGLSRRLRRLVLLRAQR